MRRPVLVSLLALALLGKSVPAGAATDVDDSGRRHNIEWAQAAPAPQPLYDQLMRVLKRDYLNIRFLLQTIADFHMDPPPAGSDGFYIGDARVRVMGALDEGFEYATQIDFTRAPVILDARLAYRFSPDFRMNAGLYKAPFSYEYLTFSGGIDFIERSQVVEALAPKRQIGASIDGTFADGGILVHGGVFNGTGSTLAGNNNNRFMYVARFAVQPDLAQAGDRILIGLNAAFNSVGQNDPDRHTTIGGDVRAELGRWLLGGEVVQRSVALPTDETETARGFHLTGGLMVAPQHQLLMRFDSYVRPDPLPQSNLLLLGYNYWPTRPVKFQINYIVPTTDAAGESHRIMGNFQVVL